MSKESFYAVIMAGGGGTRLWPLSRKDNPKQLLRLISEKSLFQLAVERLKEIFKPDHIYVVTVQEQYEKLMREVPQIPSENFLIEPMPKGTASVVALAAAHLQKREPKSIMAVLTADHIIENVLGFQNILSEAELLAHRDLLITLGIKPTFPSSGYGYIHIGSSISGSNAFHVIEFVEKPSVEIAQKYVESTKYYWNSGMFIWKTETIVNEIEYLMPELARITKKISKIIGTPKYEVELPALWSEITPQTIDYGVMEKARKVAVLPAPNLGWSDIGSWDSLAELLPGDADENRILADQVLIHQSHNCLIKQDGSLRLITIAGLDDIVIVDTKDVLLVCKRNETQVVRKIVDILKDNQLTKYL